MQAFDHENKWVNHNNGACTLQLCASGEGRFSRQHEIEVVHIEDVGRAFKSLLTFFLGLEIAKDF